jgi:hypothetical protein
MKKTFSKHTALLIAVYCSVLLSPALFVSNTSVFSRGLWCSFVAVFALLLSALWHFRGSLTTLEQNSFVAKPVLTTLAHTILPTALLVSIVCANFILQSETAAWAAEVFIEIMSHVFPWVSAVKQHYGDWVTAEKGQILKTQVIVCIWFICGGFFFGLCAWLNFSTPILRTPETSGKEKKRHEDEPFIQLLMGSFALFVALSAYNGWMEFGASNGRDCLINISCYAQDDLAIIVAAFLKVFGVFGFGFFLLALSEAVLAQCVSAIMIQSRFFKKSCLLVSTLSTIAR